MRKKESNSELLRKFSNGELAEFIYKVKERRVKLCKNECSSCESSNRFCISNIFEWLISEAKEHGNQLSISKFMRLYSKNKDVCKGTSVDKIRNMTDWELAEFIYKYANLDTCTEKN